MIFFLLILTSFNIPSAFSSITALTLFQFGGDRLDPGTTTLPLSPLGTASDNSETTYLYRAITLTTISRTMIISASGWAEPFLTATIECKFIDSTEGECFGGTTGTATGKPTPNVFQVANPTTTPAPTILTTSNTLSATTVPTTANGPNGPQKSRSSSVGAIVGGTIAGVAVISAVVIFILWRRGKRLRRQASQSNFHPEDVIPHQATGAINPYLIPSQSTQSHTEKKRFTETERDKSQSQLCATSTKTCTSRCGPVRAGVWSVRGT
ncbi:hypothetical protein BDP27DRAFT_1443014 [Rhodocollybia butyracea]|uniref:Mid2 domain-containing protein n=1 Tax=Rhodocollybia butyracea TaxID=206335 RepID=A0A9P5Q6I7_9AGAR|nr:hypothetical protein BDP27DRAFT_1443014 [Rhodocollybia butyracea]